MLKGEKSQPRILYAAKISYSIRGMEASSSILKADNQSTYLFGGMLWEFDYLIHVTCFQQCLADYKHYK